MRSLKLNLSSVLVVFGLVFFCCQALAKDVQIPLPQINTVPHVTKPGHQEPPRPFEEAYFLIEDKDCSATTEILRTGAKTTSQPKNKFESVYAIRNGSSWGRNSLALSFKDGRALYFGPGWKSKKSHTSLVGYLQEMKGWFGNSGHVKPTVHPKGEIEQEVSYSYDNATGKGTNLKSNKISVDGVIAGQSTDKKEVRVVDENTIEFTLTEVARGADMLTKAEKNKILAELEKAGREDLQNLKDMFFEKGDSKKIVTVCRAVRAPLPNYPNPDAAKTSGEEGSAEKNVDPPSAVKSE